MSLVCIKSDEMGTFFIHLAVYNFGNSLSFLKFYWYDGLLYRIVCAVCNSCNTFAA